MIERVSPSLKPLSGDNKFRQIVYPTLQNQFGIPISTLLFGIFLLKVLAPVRGAEMDKDSYMTITRGWKG